jgi:hypothetical protein
MTLALFSSARTHARTRRRTNPKKSLSPMHASSVTCVWICCTVVSVCERSNCCLCLHTHIYTLLRTLLRSTPYIIRAQRTATVRASSSERLAGRFSCCPCIVVSTPMEHARSRGRHTGVASRWTG